ncbi:hypothetical protein [Paractinoplanes atraurantiacus]|uniref:Tryptophan-associated transmembrane protein (Trp_oprn_chp) n=1 Tax=Paractinoplanes atraurantiacus TaxID=1036182 RepID=A0A285KG07_9ACTN|nr:hypothetical protein [Actinoplanes atraurantiacus]SNY71193.1 hypothetical protein SAMN05421748_13950 [Actinoplanes atraurantiacus]
MTGKQKRVVWVCSALLGGFAVVSAVMVLDAVPAWRHYGPAADSYLRLYTGYDREHAESLTSSVRTGLGYQTGLAVVAALATAGLAVVVHLRRRWVRATVWCTLGALGMGLLFSFTAGEATREASELLPPWYPGLTAALSAVLLATAVVVVVLMSKVEDFHEPDPREPDPRWESFVRRQAERP